MLLSVVYGNENDLKAETVESNSSRFSELVKEGIHQVIEEKGGLEYGTVNRVLIFNYYEISKHKFQKIISFSLDNKIVKFVDFKAFKMRGLTIKKFSDQRYGDRLAVEIDNNEISPKNKTESDNILYAIRVVTRFNEKLISKLNELEQSPKPEDGVNNKIIDENADEKMKSADRNEESKENANSYVPKIPGYKSIFK